MKILVLILSVLLHIVPAYAGPSTSGGGGAFVCRDSNGQVTSSELLDLWEAKNLYQWNIVYGKMPIQKFIDRAIENLAGIDTEIADLVKVELKKIRDEAIYLPTNIALTAPVDANHLYMKPGCPLEGMLYYDAERAPQPGVVVDTAIFSKLQSATDIAAAWVHEAVYKVYRDKFKATASVDARKVTACLFATDFPCLEEAPLGKDKALNDKNMIEPAMGAHIFDCESNSMQLKFQVYKSGDTDKYISRWVVAVTQVGSRIYSKPVYTKEYFSTTLPNDTKPLKQTLTGGLSWLNYNYGYFPRVTIRSVDDLKNPTKINVTVTEWDPTPNDGEDNTEFLSYRPMSCKIVN